MSYQNCVIVRVNKGTMCKGRVGFNETDKDHAAPWTRRRVVIFEWHGECCLLGSLVEGHGQPTETHQGVKPQTYTHSAFR